MKDLKIITLLITLLLFSILIKHHQKNELNLGAIAFTGFNASLEDSFSIIILEELKPNSIIYFTDSEWNGSHFGADEGNLIWNSGNKIINYGTIVTFKNINKNASASIGYLKNTIKLSKKEEALFAYIGNGPKSPNKFLAAVANSKFSYGTLINTGLVYGKTAITYPKGTYSAKIGIDLPNNKKAIIQSLNNMANYKLNTSIEYSRNRLAKN